MMHFSRKVAPLATPVLKLNGCKIQVSQSVRFLELHWDPKLSWNVHINKTKAKCIKDMNLLKTVSSEEWEADTEVLMRIYRAVIRPKINYGCLVYGAANPTKLRELKVVANEAMMINTGAIITPAESLRIIVNESELERRRK